MPQLGSIYLCTLDRTLSRNTYFCKKKLIEAHNRESRKSADQINPTYLSTDDLPDPEQMDRNSVVIFDDVMGEKIDERVGSFFMRSRHREISVFYLAQSYCKIPSKSAIRQNVSYMIIFRTDMKALRQIYLKHKFGNGK